MKVECWQTAQGWYWRLWKITKVDNGSEYGKRLTRSYSPLPTKSAAVSAAINWCAWYSEEN